jgi:hypothetical protein
MINYNSPEALLIRETTAELEDRYVVEAMFGSRCSLWLCALNCGVVSRELYDQAAEYNGTLWHYVGD